jgi:hypothetical protein
VPSRRRSVRLGPLHPSRREFLPNLEAWTTQRFIWTVLLGAGIPTLAFVAVVALTPVSLADASTFVDSIVKILVTIIAAMWALNRYFLGRVDANQVRIDPQVELVKKPDQESAALVYSIDIVNTGKVLLENYQIKFQISAVDFNDRSAAPSYYVVTDTPRHSGHPIEPSSWAAISGVEIVPSALVAVRLYIEIERASGGGWTWHRTVKVDNS